MSNDKKLLNFARKILDNEAMSINSLILYMTDVFDSLDKEQITIVASNLSKARDLLISSSNLINKRKEEI